MDLYLLTTPDYSAVVGYAERGERDPGDFAMADNRRVTGYGTDQQPLFTRKGLYSADRRVHELGFRLVTATYFDITASRPEHVPAPACARQQAERRAQRHAQQHGGAA